MGVEPERVAAEVVSSSGADEARISLGGGAISELALALDVNVRGVDSLILSLLWISMANSSTETGAESNSSAETGAESDDVTLLMLN